MSDLIFTVSGLNGFIRDVITSGFPGAVWVCGEIQGYRVDQKGHAYFEIVENEEGTHTVKAKIRASIWSSRKAFIESVLKRVENGFSLRDDIQVKFLCKVDFWQKGGTVSLSVENVDPTYTLGKIAQERQKLIALLKSQGLLDKNKQLQLPAVVLNVGLITSFDSAAYNDFVHELKLSKLSFKIWLANAVMQGKGAESAVLSAFKSLERVAQLDVIVITRGGGSIAELSCFDSEAIARVIAASSLPVITGIGHEINTTVADLTAHTFAKTPTAVAQFLVGRVRDFLNELDNVQSRLIEFSKSLLDKENDALRQRALRFQSGTRTFFKDHEEYILRSALVLKQVPVSIIKEARKKNQDRLDRLRKGARICLTGATGKMNSNEKLITMAGPVNTLRRGFSITRDQKGRAVRQLAQVSKGQNLVTELPDGTFESKVL